MLELRYVVHTAVLIVQPQTQRRLPSCAQTIDNYNKFATLRPGERGCHGKVKLAVAAHPAQVAQCATIDTRTMWRGACQRIQINDCQNALSQRPFNRKSLGNASVLANISEKTCAHHWRRYTSHQAVGV